MLFYGCKLKETNLADIRQELLPVKSKIQEIAEKEYKRLVGVEAAFLGDAITLGAMERNPEVDYLSLAKERVDILLRNFRLKGIWGTYNFSVYGYFIPYKNHVYLRESFRNPIFKEAFDEFSDISISKDEFLKSDGFLAELWNTAVRESKKAQPLSIDLSPDTDHIELENLSFPDRMHRVSVWARHQEINRTISELQLDGDPAARARTIQLVDEAFDMYLRKEKEEGENGQMEADRNTLMNTLLDFNETKNKNTLKRQKKEKKA